MKIQMCGCLGKKIPKTRKSRLLGFEEERGIRITPELPLVLISLFSCMGLCYRVRGITTKERICHHHSVANSRLCPFPRRWLHMAHRRNVPFPLRHRSTLTVQPHSPPCVPSRVRDPPLKPETPVSPETQGGFRQDRARYGTARRPLLSYHTPTSATR